MTKMRVYEIAKEVNIESKILVTKLQSLGYDVTARTGSKEALELFRAKPDQFDLVITDMTMPHMPGDVLARELISIRPDIPIIVCTGYSDRINTDVADEIGIRQLIMKPVVMKEIAQVIRRVLDQTIEQTGKTFKTG